MFCRVLECVRRISEAHTENFQAIMRVKIISPMSFVIIINIRQHHTRCLTKKTCAMEMKNNDGTTNTQNRGVTGKFVSTLTQPGIEPGTPRWHHENRCIVVATVTI